MKIVISTLAMLMVVAILIFKAVQSGKEDSTAIEVYVNNHFSQVQHQNYSAIYETFHEDLRQSISLKVYEAAWKERIKKYGPLLSWKIHSANKSYNLFSNDIEYNVIIHLNFGADEVIAAVRHDWKVEEDTIKLIWTGTANGNIEAY